MYAVVFTMTVSLTADHGGTVLVLVTLTALFLAPRRAPQRASGPTVPSKKRG